MVNRQKSVLTLLLAALAAAALAAGCGGASGPQNSGPNMYDFLNSNRIKIFMANAAEIGRVQAELTSGEPADNARAKALNKKTGWTNDQTRAIAMTIVSGTEFQSDPMLLKIYNVPALNKNQKALFDQHQPELDRAVKTYKDSLVATMRQREKAGKKVPYRRP